MSFLLVLLLVSMVSFRGDFVEGCSCFPAHPQELFCNSQFVIKALVTSQDHSKTDSRLKMKSYSITFLEVFRGKEVLDKLLVNSKEVHSKDLDYIETVIMTPSSPVMCGVQLNFTDTYLIFGQIVDGELQVNLCNFIADWELITNQVKAGIYGDYDCRCSIETKMHSIDTNKINNGEKQQLKPSSTCYWEMFPDEPVDECALNYITCRKLVHPMSINNEEEQCVWVEGRDYEVCQLAAEVKENDV